MNRTRILMDPTSERSPALRDPLPLPDTLEGKTVAFLDISKARGNVFLDRLEEKFAANGVAVKRYAKPTFTRVAPVDLKQQITANCHVVIEALAD